MRFADILKLALSALWQQKARALLATLGVIFGSFVLVASLSVGQGVQDTIERESHRSDYLRRIDVRPQWGGRETDIPAEQLTIQGDMSDAKRERIKKALVAYKLRHGAGGPRVLLTRDRLEALARLDHVESVVPIVSPVWLRDLQRPLRIDRDGLEPARGCRDLASASWRGAFSIRWGSRRPWSASSFCTAGALSTMRR